MEKSITRLLIAGNVDDGKNAIRETFESGQSKRSIKAINNRRKRKLEFSKVSDGLIDELQLGITIDVAYKFLRQIKKFIIADCQDTFNIQETCLGGYNKRCHIC